MCIQVLKMHMKFWRNRPILSCYSRATQALSYRPAMAQNVVKGLKNCRLVQLSSGLHYLQEDHPDVIGANIKEWLIEVGIDSSPKQKLAL